MLIDRRRFVFALVATAGCSSQPEAAPPQAPPILPLERVAFITDEYDQQLEEAIAFGAEFELQQVEIRNFWGKYGFMHDVETLKRARALLDDAGLTVCALSTPLLKCIAPGFEPIERVRLDIQLAQNGFPEPDDKQYERTPEYLDRAIQAALILGTDKIRCFSFWRTEDVASSYPLLIEKLHELGEVAAKSGMKLAMENEHACNVADCGEAMQVLPKAPENVGMIWDCLNGVSTGEKPYPDGYNKLEMSRLFHVQLKDADLSAGTERFTYTAVGDGDMPYREIFQALARDGYPGSISMETHFSLDGTGSRKSASRRSMQGILSALQPA